MEKIGGCFVGAHRVKFGGKIWPDLYAGEAQKAVTEILNPKF